MTTKILLLEGFISATISWVDNEGIQHCEEYHDAEEAITCLQLITGEICLGDLEP